MKRCIHILMIASAGILLLLFLEGVTDDVPGGASGRLTLAALEEEEIDKGVCAAPIEGPPAFDDNGSAAPSLQRSVASDSPLRIVFEGELLDQLIGTAEIFQLNAEIVSRGRERGLFGSSLLGDNPIWTADLDGRELAVHKSLPDGQYLLRVKVHGAHLFAQAFNLPISNRLVNVPLTRADGIRCAVQTEEGAAVEGAEIRISRSTEIEVHYPTIQDSIVSASQAEIITTDQSGVAFLPWPPQFSVRLHIIPPAPYAELILWGIEDGANIKAQVAVGCSVKGQVRTETSRQPIPHCRIAAYVNDDDGYQVPICGTETNEEGEYCLEGVDVRRGSIILFAEKAGHAGARKLIAPITAGEVYEEDFSLRLASAGAFQLVDQHGRPISNLAVHLLADGGEVVPFSYLTNSNGEFTTGEYLVAGSMYRMNAVVGGLTRGLASFQARPEGSPIHCITVADMGRVLREFPNPSDEPLDTIEFELLNEQPVMVFQWQEPFAPTWLPSGEYRVTAFASDGLRAQSIVQVQGSSDSLLELSTTKTTLSFDIPLNSGIKSLTLFTSSNISVWESEATRSDYLLEIPPGDYYISILDSDGYWFDTPVFECPAAGLQLGELLNQLPGVAEVNGILITEAGMPVTGAELFLAAKTGYRCPRVTTGNDGWFTFNKIPIGEYSLAIGLPQRADNEALYFERHVDFDSADRAYFLSLEIPTEEMVVVQIPADIPSVSRAFMLCAGGAAWTSIQPNLTYRVPAPSDVAITGVCTHSNSEITILTAPMLQGKTRITLTYSDLVTSSVSLRKMSASAEFVRVGVELEGNVIAEFPASSGADLLVRHPLSASAALIFRDFAGQTIRVLLPKLGGRVEPQANSPAGRLQINIPTSRDGSPLLVQIPCCGLRSVLHHSGTIELRCLQPSHEVLLESNRMMSLRGRFTAGANITLKPEAALRHISLDVGAAGDKATLEITSSDRVRSWAVPPSGVVTVFDLPCGSATITLRDSDGIQVLSRTEYLAESGPRSLILR